MTIFFWIMAGLIGTIVLLVLLLVINNGRMRDDHLREMDDKAQERYLREWRKKHPH